MLMANLMYSLCTQLGNTTLKWEADRTRCRSIGAGFQVASVHTSETYVEACVAILRRLFLNGIFETTTWQIRDRPV